MPLQSVQSPTIEAFADLARRYRPQLAEETLRIETIVMVKEQSRLTGNETQYSDPYFLLQTAGGRAGVSALDERQLEAYRQRLERRALGQLIGTPIELHVRAIDFGASDATPQTIAELVRDRPSRVVILGNPGAGKSTLVQNLCLDWIGQSGGLPLIVDLKKFSQRGFGVRALVDAQQREVAGVGLSDSFAPNLLVFDGLNEVQDGHIDQALDEVVEFCESQEMAGVPAIVTCRTIDFPPSIATGFERYEVAQVEREQAISFIGNKVGLDWAELVWNRLSWQTQELCRVPLLLSMLVFVLDKDDPTNTVAPTSRNELYYNFMRRLDERSRRVSMIETPDDIRWSCLSFLAFSLDNQRFDVPRLELQSLITRHFDRQWGIAVATLQHEVLDLPPMGAPDGWEDQPSSRSFMHQSFQEFFAARHLLQGLESQLPGSISVEDLAAYVQSQRAEWRETIGFLSGMLGNSSELIELCRRHGNYKLAALCIEHAEAVSPELVDDVALDVLDDFKFGDAFDYEQILTLKTMLPRRSAAFPARVLSDIEYWSEKYGRSIPRELVTLSERELILLARSGSRFERLNAVWTLGRRVSIEAVTLLEELATAGTDDDLREQSVVALGRILPETSFNLFVDIAKSKTESRWLRSYAVHGLGGYPIREAVDLLLSFLSDPELCDDAAWALSLVASKSPEAIADVVGDLVTVLYTPELDRYTKGCLLFILGCGRFDAVASQVVEYLSSETDPYILEDGCYALGQICDSGSASFLAEVAATHEDIVVVRHANRALARVAEGPSEES